MHYFNSKTKTKSNSKSQFGGKIILLPSTTGPVLDNVFVTGDNRDQMFNLREDLMSFFNGVCDSNHVIEIGRGFDLKIVYLGEKHIIGSIAGGHGMMGHGVYDGKARIWIQKNNSSDKVRYVIEIKPGEHWDANREPENWLRFHIPNALNQINSDPLLLLSKLNQLGVNVQQIRNLEQLLGEKNQHQAIIDDAKQQLDVATRRHDEANMKLKQFIDQIKVSCGEQLKWTFIPEKSNVGHASQALPSPSQALPVGWIQQNDPTTGHPYYVDTTTGLSQWNRPVLPAGWTELTDPSSERRYYSNGSKTQWEYPM